MDSHLKAGGACPGLLLSNLGCCCCRKFLCGDALDPAGCCCCCCWWWWNCGGPPPALTNPADVVVLVCRRAPGGRDNRSIIIETGVETKGEEMGTPDKPGARSGCAGERERGSGHAGACPVARGVSLFTRSHFYKGSTVETKRA